MQSRSIDSYPMYHQRASDIVICMIIANTILIIIVIVIVMVIVVTIVIVIVNDVIFVVIVIVASTEVWQARSAKRVWQAMIGKEAVFYLYMFGILFGRTGIQLV